MKRLSAIANVTLVILLAFTFMTPAMADEEANRDECIARGEEAVKLIKEVGNEAALKKIQNTIDDEDMRFYWENGFVYVIEDEKATILVHPAFPGAVNREYLNVKDADGTLYCQEIIRITKTKGEGWIPCNIYGKIYGKRDCYVLKVPDTNLIVVSINLK